MSTKTEARTAGVTTAETSLALTAEEREFLVGILQLAQKETLIEEHRTRTLNYREHIVHREHVIADLLRKLRPTP
jgi:hypothetical protein